MSSGTSYDYGGALMRRSGRKYEVLVCSVAHLLNFVAGNEDHDADGHENDAHRKKCANDPERREDRLPCLPRFPTKFRLTMTCDDYRTSIGEVLTFSFCCLKAELDGFRFSFWGSDGIGGAMGGP